MTIIEHITEAIMTDDYDKSPELYHKFLNYSPDIQKIIDDFFVTLCGYSLTSLADFADHSSIDDDGDDQ